MKTQKIRVENAVGMVLSHDLTKIVKDSFKGPAFRKGHIITEDDVSELLKMGKQQIYVLELESDDIHEDEAGICLGRAGAGDGITCSPPKESRVNLFAAMSGLLKVNVPALKEVNNLPEVIFSTLTNNTPVKEGDMVAGTKVIPLTVKEQVVRRFEEICQKNGPLVEVVPYQKKKVGLIVTGSEVYAGRIKDTFGPVLQNKVADFGSEVISFNYAPDDAEVIASKINEAIDCGAEIVLVSGGMSVDPDDVTPLGIRLSGAEIIKYGAPILPGAMFLLAYRGDVPVIGVPACGMYYRITVLDLVLSRILTGERLTCEDIVAYAHGGLCRSCNVCHYPKCSFGQAGI